MSVPSRLGRYRVIAPLAAGGMAEVLLGALEGGAGFARPVVIKRVLPHLARRKDLRMMFVDEARIVIGLRHPNIVSVLELGQEDGELYLVMEYLEGEGVDSIARRLFRGQQPMPLTVACHIVADGALGLHAAHEHVDERGQALGIVHRDVSPHNLFVGYDGGVKVIDFGVARADNRDARTDTGTIKGKLAYMSPEQVEGADVDRRTDVFALGTVLFELLTGKRLFHRSNHAETVRAVLNARIAPPSELRPDVPPALDAVVLKALERDPDARYATAAELRREILIAVRSASPEAIPQDDCAAMMSQLFADRIAAKRSMLHALSTGSRPAAVPTGDPDVEELDIVVAPASDDPASSDEEPTSAAPFGQPVGVEATGTLAGRSRSRRSGLALAGAIVVVLVLVAGLARVLVPTESTTEAVLPRPTSRPAEMASAPSTPPPPPPSSGPSVASSPEAPVVHLVLDSEPAGAEILLDGEHAGTTPATIERAREDRTVHVALSLAGTRPVERDVSLDGDFTERFVLEPVRTTPPPTSARPVASTARADRHRATPRPPPESAPERGFFRVE